MGRRKCTETRAIVLEMLMELLPAKEETAPVKTHLLIRDVLEKYDYMDVRDKSFIKRLAEGCVERKITLDYVIGQYSRTGVTRMKPVILNILRMGVYQILYMDAVPDAAACNEAVNLTVSKGLQGLKGFVNGVLRTVSREKEQIDWPPKENKAQYFSVRYSMPVWLVNMWLKTYDAKTLEKMLEEFQKPSALTVRLKESMTKEQQEHWKTEILRQGCRISEHPYLSYAYRLEHVDGVAKLYGYEEGMFAVQDISSMLAVELAGIREGDLVIDVCAAPGGKAMHAAEKTGTFGIVDARDISEYKVGLIRENAMRLHPAMLEKDRIRIRIWDAADLDESMIGKADVVIADLPCSGLGVIGHKADIRYRVTEEQICELAALQREILGTVYRYLKPGGILIYSTCTISEEENEKNAAWILEHLPLEAAPLGAEMLREKIITEETKMSAETIMPEDSSRIQLLPGIHQSDGFFIAKFRRKRNGR